MQIEQSVTRVYDEMSLPIDFPYLYERSRLRERDLNNYALHSHDCFELGLCHTGRGVYFIDNELYHFKPGDITVIPPMKAHMGASGHGENSEWSWLFFHRVPLFNDRLHHPDLLETIPAAAFLPSPQNDLIGALFHTIIDESIEKSDYYRDRVEVNLCSLFLEILKILPEEPRNSGDSGNDPELNRIRPSLYYIHNNYHRTIHVAQLADLCGMSMTGFRNHFTRVMGDSPYKYILRFKVSMACTHLLKGNMTIEQAARECGFPTLSCFFRQFKQQKGHSPGQWLKEQREM